MSDVSPLVTARKRALVRLPEADAFGAMTIYAPSLSGGIDVHPTSPADDRRDRGLPPLPTLGP